MAADVIQFHALPAEDRWEARAGVGVLERAGAGDRLELTLIRSDGSRESVTMPAGVTALVRDVLEQAAGTGRVAVLREDSELSPEQAARILGVSRPLVVLRMDDGRLPFRRVGAHRRARLGDVLRLREREQAQREALERLAADTEDLMVGHGL